MLFEELSRMVDGWQSTQYLFYLWYSSLLYVGSTQSLGYIQVCKYTYYIPNALTQRRKIEDKSRGLSRRSTLPWMTLPCQADSFGSRCLPGRLYLMALTRVIWFLVLWHLNAAQRTSALSGVWFIIRNIFSPLSCSTVVSVHKPWRC